MTGPLVDRAECSPSTCSTFLCRYFSRAQYAPASASLAPIWRYCMRIASGRRGQVAQRCMPRLRFCSASYSSLRTQRLLKIRLGRPEGGDGLVVVGISFLYRCLLLEHVAQQHILLSVLVR